MQSLFPLNGKRVLSILKKLEKGEFTRNCPNGLIFIPSSLLVPDPLSSDRRANLIIPEPRHAAFFGKKGTALYS
jgi:hypothetical protein